MTPSSLREPLHLVPVANYWPRGVEAVLHYDYDYVLNDRRRVDRIVVTEIGGLDDPDVVVSNEKNSGVDGETPGDGTYGGRTITLRGFIAAGSADRLRQLNSYLKDAFDDLTERYLWFRWMDWYDDFADSLALSDYTYDSGSGLSASSSGLVPTSTAMKRIYLSVSSRFAYGDVEATVKVTPDTAANQGVSLVVGRTSATNYLRMGFVAGVLTISRFPAGTVMASNSPTTTQPTADVPYWLRARREGNSLTLSYFASEPTDTSTPTIAVTHTISGGDIALYGTSAAAGSAGVEWTPVTTADRINLLDVAALNKGDAQVLCRKFAKIDGPEAQEGSEFQRSFFITLRASNPLLVSRKLTKVQIAPPASTPVAFDYRTFYTTTLTNLGRSPAPMMVTLTGPMNNPRMVLGNGQELSLRMPVGFTLTSGISYFIDTWSKSVIDILGASQADNISDETTWPRLDRGSNTVLWGADKIDTFQSAVAGTNLNGRAGPSPTGTWATSGAATDLQFVDSGGTIVARRSVTGDAAGIYGLGRIALLGTLSYVTTDISIQYTASALSNPNGPEHGLIARYVDSNNYLQARHYGVGGIRYAQVAIMISGVATALDSRGDDIPISQAPNQWYMMRLIVKPTGHGRLIVYEIDSLEDFLIPLGSSDFYSSQLATGGTHDDGRVGFLDHHAGGYATSRDYMNFSVMAPLDQGSIEVQYRHSSR